MEILWLFAAIVAVYIVFLLRDILQNHTKTAEDQGSFLYFACGGFLIYFLTAFGMSDSALAMLVYRFQQKVPIGKLPATIVAGCTLPMSFLSVSYMGKLEVGFVTVVLMMGSCMIGAVFGTNVISKCRPKVIKVMLVSVLLLSMVMLVVKLFFLPESDGSGMGNLSAISMAGLCLACFLLMAMAMVGFSCTASFICIFMLMGAEPLSALALAVTMGALGSVTGSINCLRLGAYHRKAMYMTALFGSVGSVTGAMLVKHLNTDFIPYLMLLILAVTLVKMVRDPAEESV